MIEVKYNLSPDQATALWKLAQPTHTLTVLKSQEAYHQHLEATCERFTEVIKGILNTAFQEGRNFERKMIKGEDK